MRAVAANAAYFNRNGLTGLQYALRDAGLPFRDNGTDLLGRPCRIRCEAPNDGDTIKRSSDFHVFGAKIESFALDESAEVLVFEISKNIFGPERLIRSLNFDLQKKKWFLRVGDGDYDDPDIYKCDFTLL